MNWSYDVSYGGSASTDSPLSPQTVGEIKLTYEYDEIGVVPEPLTILGAGTAIAFGGAFKRKLAKNSKKK